MRAKHARQIRAGIEDARWMEQRLTTIEQDTAKAATP